MTTGFQQQQSHYTPSPRALPRPQHGAAPKPLAADAAPVAPERRSFR